MLKKAGIVVAASAAGLLAVGGFAFASDNGGENSQKGLVNLQNTNAQVPVQACNNSLLTGAVGILAKDVENKDSHKGKCKQNNEANN